MNKKTVILGLLCTSLQAFGASLANTNWNCRDGTRVEIHSAYEDSYSIDYHADASHPSEYSEGRLMFTNKPMKSGVITDAEGTKVGQFRFIGNKLLLTVSQRQTVCTMAGDFRE
jgi:hypothetical protein